MQYTQIEIIDEVLKEGGDADAVLPGGKHGPDWLVGRQGSLETFVQPSQVIKTRLALQSHKLQGRHFLVLLSNF
ncbi:hypothetical protein OROHE_006124 [Orobanche hederae]